MPTDGTPAHADKTDTDSASGSGIGVCRFSQARSGAGYMPLQ